MHCLNTLNTLKKHFKQTLNDLLQNHPLPKPGCLWVAYSGGLDSRVLLEWLHCFVNSQSQDYLTMAAIHIDHQWSTQSKHWVEHCVEVCRRLGCRIHVTEITVKPKPGQSLEASARTQRYQALSEAIQPNDWILTAHHQNDQVETLLLNLIRGSGLAGLQAMPLIRPLGSGYLVRPLLTLSRDQLEAYAQSKNWVFIEDPSNQNQRFDRNYIRHQILPLLTSRWPAAISTMARTSMHCQQAFQALEPLQQNRSLCVDQQNRLTLSALKRFKSAEQLYLIHAWLKELGLTIPTAKQYRHLQSDLIHCRRADHQADHHAEVAWPGALIKRYRDKAYAFEHAVFLPDPQSTLTWADREQRLTLPGDLGWLTASPQEGRGFHWPSDQPLIIRFALPGLGLKKLYQSKGIPPWERLRCPLLFLNGVFLGVAGLGFPCLHPVLQDQIGWVIQHHP